MRWHCSGSTLRALLRSMRCNVRRTCCLSLNRAQFKFDAVPPDLALNTAGQFRHATQAWQSYAESGETTHELPRTDGGDHRSVLSLGRNRRRRGNRAGAGLRAPVRTDDRQLLGRSDAGHALCVVVDLRRGRAVPRLAGRAADTRRVCQRDHLGRRQSGSGARTGRVADGDQATERRRRRLLQCKLGTSVRKSYSSRRHGSRCC